MNQILSTENINNNKKKNYKSKGTSTGAKDMKSILRFFAIMLIVFGALIAGNGVLALNNGGNSNNSKVSQTTTPQIMVESKGEDKVLITITDEADIDNVTYQWNDETEQKIQGASGKFVQKEIDLPDGENVLSVKALNVDGGVKEINKKFESVATIGIKMTISGNNIKVDINGKEQIEKFTYAWDDEEAKEVTVNDTSYSMQIEAIIGEHTLKIVATDVNGVEKEKEQKVRGTTKPTLNITKGDGAYHIEAYDEIGLDRIEITTLKDGKVKKIKSDGKELEYDFPLNDGEDNLIQVVAINTNDVESKKIRAKWPRNVQAE